LQFDRHLFAPNDDDARLEANLCVLDAWRDTSRRLEQDFCRPSKM
jgi:hypothetical protein